MNCGQVRDRAPLYLSGEMEGGEREQLDRHLAACPACEWELAQQALLDAQIRKASDQSPDTGRVKRQVRRGIAAELFRRRVLTASLLAAAAAIYTLWPISRIPRLCRDAARDHHAEVVALQPRHWRSGATEIEALAAPSGLSFARLTALAPAGFRLERVKTCGLDGRRMLHLVFSDGSKEYSVYVRPNVGPKEDVRVLRSNAEQVAAFETGRFTAMVVVDGRAQDCRAFAGFVSKRL